MKREVAQALTEETRGSYDKFAHEFSVSRARFWDELADLAEYTKAGDRVLDIGCGNGRLYGLLKPRGVTYAGIDNSQGLLNEARTLHPEASFTLGDATALSFPDQSFDTTFSIAALHHIPSKELRKKFITEASRVLVPGGTLVLTVWNLWSRKYFIKILVSTLKCIFFVSPLDIGDLMLTFGREKYPRYLHAFTMKELRKLIAQNGFTVIKIQTVSRKSGQKNIVVVAQKAH